VFFHKDGSQVPVACSNAPLMIEGRIAGSVLVAHDITERKRTDAALRESEARYRTAGEAIRYGVWVCNPEGGVEFVSQTFLDLIGNTLDEVKPRGWLDRLPPEDLKPTLEAWHECVRTGSEWTWEHRVKGKDGAWRTILSLGRPVRDDRDRITSWVGFNLDITARKEAEDALRESENLMRALLDASQDEILLMSTQGEVLAINKAAQRRLARRTGGFDLVGAHLDRLLPQDQVESRDGHRPAGSSTATLVHHEVPIRSRWFEFWFYPVLQPDKPVSEVAVYAREITEQKKSQADLSKLFQAIQQSPMSGFVLSSLATRPANSGGVKSLTRQEDKPVIVPGDPLRSNLLVLVEDGPARVPVPARLVARAAAVLRNGFYVQRPTADLLVPSASCSWPRIPLSLPSPRGCGCASSKHRLCSNRQC
jgi:PAS domain S-box-containing protein